MVIAGNAVTVWNYKTHVKFSDHHHQSRRKMTFARKLVIFAFKGITNAICRIDDDQLKVVPDRGPLILVTNHVNLVEIPILYTCLQPRPVTGLVLARRWDNFYTRWLLDVCGAIPLRRGEADLKALRKAMEMLSSGYLVVIAPEGTRSGDGRLQSAHSGVVLLALHSQAPLLPVAWYGAEGYIGNLKRFSRSDLHFLVGRSFTLNASGEKITRPVRLQMLDEVMYQLARILPPAYRGVYADLSRASQEFIRFV